MRPDAVWGGASRPKWSPNGEWIAYTVGFQEIWLVRPDGTDEHVLVAGQEPAWSPDAQWILHNAPIDPQQGVQLSPNDWSLREVAGGEVVGEPRSLGPGRFEWTPDGHLLTTAAAFRTELAMLNISTLKRTVTPLPAGANVAWAPDGVQLAITTIEMQPGSFRQTISLLSDIASQPMAVAEGYGPIWSPDGTRIAFFNPQTGGGLASTIAMLNADGAPLEIPEQVAAEFAWSPDSTWLAIVLSLGLTPEDIQEVWLWSPDGSIVTVGPGREPDFAP